MWQIKQKNQNELGSINMKRCSFLKLLSCISSQRQCIVVERTIVSLLGKSSSNIDSDFTLTLYVTLGKLFHLSLVS